MYVLNFSFLIYYINFIYSSNVILFFSIFNFKCQLPLGRPPPQQNHVYAYEAIRNNLCYAHYQRSLSISLNLLVNSIVATGPSR